MAHMAKYTRGAVGNMLAHYDRTKEDIPNIDRGLTCQNFNCAELTQPLPQKDFLRQRLSEVHCSRRKDVNVFADWVVTLPQDVPAGDTHDFFRATYDFLKDLYGQKNVISAYVHMDETTPHMHFAFIPVVWDKKRQREKVSAKELLNIRHLRGFHEKLSDYVSEQLGYTPSILNGATIEGNKSIEELKRRSATERLEEAKREAEEIKANARLVGEDIKEAARVKANRDIAIGKSALKEVKKTTTNLKFTIELKEKELKDMRTAAVREAEEIKRAARLEAQNIIDDAKNEAELIKNNAQYEAKLTSGEAESIINNAWDEAEDIINDAWEKAEEIQGNSLRMLREKYETLKRNIKKLLDRFDFYESEKKDIYDELGISDIDTPKRPVKRFSGPRL